MGECLHVVVRDLHITPTRRHHPAPDIAGSARRSARAEPARLDLEEGEAGTIAGWHALAQVCRIHREVEYVSGARAGETTNEWAYALTSLPPEQADATRLEQLWRGHWQIENGLQYVRDVTLVRTPARSAPSAPRQSRRLSQRGAQSTPARWRHHCRRRTATPRDVSAPGPRPPGDPVSMK